MYNSNIVDDRVNLIRNIINNHISKKQVDLEIQRMEECYGEKAFTGYRLDPAKKPWTKVYYQELQKLGVAGAASKEFMLRLVEVRDTLKRRKICIIAACGSSILILVAVAAFLANHSKTGL